MNKLTIKAICVIVFIWLLPSITCAESHKLTCGPNKSIGAFLKILKPGDTLWVSGTCNENIVIPEEVLRITLDGQGTATINGGSGTVEDAITIKGRGIKVKGFKITGGRHGVGIDEGGSATIDNNEIAYAETHGISITNNSTAVVINNQIHDNLVHGIAVMNNSSAHIGVAFPAGAISTSGPNNIFQNGNHGIQVIYSSFATARNNFIYHNNRFGIVVNGGSSSTIIDNNFTNNSGGNIVIFDGSNASTSGNVEY